MPSSPIPQSSINGARIKYGDDEFAAGFLRIAQALNIKTQLELADLLNVRQSSISDAKRRGVIPGEWALKLYRRHHLNPRWIYDGLPPAFLGPRRKEPRQSGRQGASFLLNYPEGAVSAMRMSDASMEPTIRRDAVVGIHVLDKGVTPGCLYGVDLPIEGETVRRIWPGRESGQALLNADNPAVPAQMIRLDGSGGIILGRAVWAMSLV